MNLPKVTIQIVTWNSQRFLADCLKSIFDQTYRDFQILIIDNNSQDQTVDFLRKNYPEVAVFKNNRNMGFARAHNQGIRLLNSPYVLICNPDIILTPKWLEKIMAAAESDQFANFGSFGGKLLKMKLINPETNETEPLDLIDSCGLQILKNHQVVELEAGQKGEKNIKDQEIFGHSGALVLYRRSALNDCLLKIGKNFNREYFDEHFFSYKEDVDLAWRAQLFGWRSWLVAEAVAYHLRSLAAPAQNSWRQIIKSRRRQSKLSRRHSYCNHFFCLIKNQFGKNLFQYFFPILFYEIKKFFYILFFEPSTLLAFFDLARLWPIMCRKRRLILRCVKVDAAYIRSWLK